MGEGGEYLKHFVDIWLISESSNELKEIINDQNRESLHVDFKMNSNQINVKL